MLTARWIAFSGMALLGVACSECERIEQQKHVDRGASGSPVGIGHREAFVAGRVFVTQGNSGLTEAVLQDAGLQRLTCLLGAESCLYSFPARCGQPDEAADRLTADIFACADGSQKADPTSKPKAQFFPDAVLHSDPVSYTTDGSHFGEDDEKFSEQYALKAMGAVNAWKSVKKDENNPVLTAVIDNGVQLDHPDLLTKLDRGTSIPCPSMPCYGGDSTAIHGTNMAGIIAAQRYNGGMIGTAWNTQMLPIAISVGDGTDTFQSAAVAAVRFALGSGARVLNFSYAGNEPTPALANVLRTANEEFLFVVPAGNLKSSGARVYPASYSISKMLVVMSHDANGNRTGAVGGAARIDIAARGDAYVTIPCVAQQPNDCSAPSAASTSNATAFVSGAVALFWSLPENWDWRAADVRQHILDTADDAPELAEYFNPPLRLNLDRMMNSVWFEGASELRVKRSKLPAINSSKAFPAGMCDGGIHDSTEAVGEPYGTAIRIVATCKRKDGQVATAHSHVYSVID